VGIQFASELREDNM